MGKQWKDDAVAQAAHQAQGARISCSDFQPNDACLGYSGGLHAIYWIRVLSH